MVATIKPWNIEAYHRHVSQLNGNWNLISSPNDLTTKQLAKFKPRYIFFPHWSWIVPNEITETYECVCFHMTDVPYGRGGSPLQNLILRNHKNTKLTALKMVSELDAGPFYGKLDLSLDGPAQEIFKRAADLTYVLIQEIIENNPIPVPQQGKPVHFQRRKPEQSRLPKTGTIQNLYDHIRMLDAKTYPPAFIEYGDFKLELSNASINKENLECRINIKKKTNENHSN